MGKCQPTFFSSAILKCLEKQVGYNERSKNGSVSEKENLKQSQNPMGEKENASETGKDEEKQKDEKCESKEKKSLMKKRLLKRRIRPAIKRTRKERLLGKPQNPLKKHLLNQSLKRMNLQKMNKKTT